MTTFTNEELDLLRQWFNAVRDLNPTYLTVRDFRLAEKIANSGMPTDTPWWLPKETEGHVLYSVADFTNEELDRRNVLAVNVVEGGLGVCKRCGASEMELIDYPTCAVMREHLKETKDEVRD